MRNDYALVRTLEDLRRLASRGAEEQTYFFLTKHIATALAGGIKDVVVMAECIGMLEGLTGQPADPGATDRIAAIVVETDRHLISAAAAFVQDYNVKNTTEYEFDQIRPSAVDDPFLVTYRVAFSSRGSKRRFPFWGYSQNRLVVECVEANWGPRTQEPPFPPGRGVWEAISEVEADAISGAPYSRHLLFDLRSYGPISKSEAEGARSVVQSGRNDVAQYTSRPFPSKEDDAPLLKMGRPTRLWFQRIWLLYLEQDHKSVECIELS